MFYIILHKTFVKEELIANNPDYTGLFRDKRPEKRGLHFLAY
jgi:hypothetical protein